MEYQKPRFARIAEVAEKVGLGKSTILAWESQGKFPRAIRLSPTLRVWLEEDIHKWILAKHAATSSQSQSVEA
jgi:prophage regulatory protein